MEGRSKRMLRGETRLTASVSQVVSWFGETAIRDGLEEVVDGEGNFRLGEAEWERWHFSEFGPFLMDEDGRVSAGGSEAWDAMFGGKLFKLGKDWKDLVNEITSWIDQGRPAVVITTGC